MQCVLLAAGYATRLYPLTENMPKALLKLGDKTILEMVTDKIDEVSDVENIYIVTNEKFYKQLLTTIQRVMITDLAQSVT